MGMVDKNSLSGETCGNALWPRLVGWLAGLTFLTIMIHSMFSFLSMSKCGQISFSELFIVLAIFLLVSVIAFSCWPLLRRSLRCLWRKEYIEVGDEYLPRINELVTWGMAAGFVNVFWIIFFRVLGNTYCVMDFSPMGPHGLWVFILLFVVINAVVLWWGFSCYRQFRVVADAQMPPDFRRILLRLPWIYLLELGGITAIYVLALLIPYDDALKHSSMALFWLVLVQMLSLFPFFWSIIGETDMKYFKYTGYGLGCRRLIPMKRWIVVGILRFLFVLIYFAIVFCGLGCVFRWFYWMF